MATFNEIWDQLRASGTPFYDLITAGQTAFVTNYQTYLGLLGGNDAGAAAGALRATRTAYAGVLRRLRQVWDPHLRDLADVIGSPDRSAGLRFWRDLHDYMVAQSEAVESRALVRGSITAGGSNNGNGTILRLTTDWAGEPCEAAHLGVYTGKVVIDETTGAVRGRETIEITNGTPGPDWLEPGGASGSVRIQGRAGSRDPILLNASFESLTGTAASPTDIPSWTSSVAVSSTTYAFDESNYYRSSPEEVAQEQARSLTVKTTSTIKQKLSTLRRSLSSDVPYMLTARVNREVGSFSGTARLSFGATDSDLALTSQTGWVLHTLALTSGCWLEVANRSDLEILLGTTRTSGTLLWDDVTFGPMTYYDGAWWYAVGGNTPWLRDDVYTVTDALSTAGEATLQYLVLLLTDFAVWLPSATGTPVTIPDIAP